MIPEVRDRDFGTRRTTWIKIACAFIFTAALVVIPVLMPNTTGAFTAKVTNPANSVTVAPAITCRQVIADEAGGVFAYQMDSTDPVNLVNGKTGTTVTQNVSVTREQTGCVNDSAVSLYFDGGLTSGSSNFVSYKTPVAPPETYTQEVWFRSPYRITNGGSLVALTNATNYGDESERSRQLYLDVDGYLQTGTHNYEKLDSRIKVNDNKWHHVVATRDKSAGMLYLYLDGALVGQTRTASSLDTFTPAYWKVGCSYLLKIAPRAASCFKGDIAFAAVYNRAFTQADVTRHYKAGTG